MSQIRVPPGTSADALMTEPPTGSTRARSITTGIAGLATVVLVFGGQALVQVGGGEPPFDASAATIAEYFAARDQTLFAVGCYLTIVAVVLFMWFVGGIHALLAPDWRATIALASGVLAVAPILTSGWEIVVFRMPEQVDPEIARLGFDLGNLSFASGWVAFGSFALATGWAALSSRALPRWLAWWAVAAGVALVTARAVWTTPAWLVGYVLFWLWVVALCVRLLRRGAA